MDSQRLGSRSPKPKVVVVMGASGTGKSKLAIDLASHFPIEIISADSMQVYHGLDVLTNKVPLNDQKEVPHHLLGNISPNTEFTSKTFRDSAIPLINNIHSRNCLPVLVGGTNYYIQALVSPFLLDDSTEDMEESCSNDLHGGDQPDSKIDCYRDNIIYNYDRLKVLDPVAANRIHPNNHRKINQYLSLYSTTGVLPSKLFQGKAIENWGRVDNFRYDCCFICVDASLPVLDQYVERRVDEMINAGLLNEVCDIYTRNSDYTRGLRQAIGVREFEEFLKAYVCEGRKNEHYSADGSEVCALVDNADEKMLKENIGEILNLYGDSQYKLLLTQAIDKVKANTRRLVRRQKRRINRLQILFGWNIHYVDTTESLLGSSGDIWTPQVVEPSVEIIKSFLNKDLGAMPDSDAGNDIDGLKLIQRDLWTQYTCQPCGNKVLRGAHEWDQHKRGRGHRKRVSLLRKGPCFSLDDKGKHPCST